MFIFLILFKWFNLFLSLFELLALEVENPYLFGLYLYILGHLFLISHEILKRISQFFDFFEKMTLRVYQKMVEVIIMNANEKRSVGFLYFKTIEEWNRRINKINILNEKSILLIVIKLFCKSKKYSLSSFCL